MVMSSCTNDDITISSTTNFTVDPSSVQGAFSLAEVNKGELESFDTNCQLNVLLYIYDDNGNKVAEFTEAFSNYNVQMKKNKFLPEGKYTAVAITYITGRSDGFKWWEISGSETLEGLRISALEYIGGKNKVLGTAVEHFVVNDNVSDLNIKVKPAGAMTTVIYYDTDYLKTNGFNNLRLCINKTMDYLEFDRSGNSHVIEKNNNQSYDWIFDYLDEEKLGSEYIEYNYEFILPMNNVGLGFRVNYENESYRFGMDGSIDFKQGASYFVLINTDEDDFSCGEITEPLYNQISYVNDGILDSDKMLNAPHAKSTQTQNLSKQITEIAKDSRTIKR